MLSSVNKKEKQINNSKLTVNIRKIQNNQVNNNRKQMHRPPRSVIKSNKIFDYHPKNRKVITPDCQIQQQQYIGEQQIRSMRDTLGQSDLHQSMNQTDNIQYLQITKNNHISAYNINMSINDHVHNSANLISGRSFKIRNVGSGKTMSISSTIKQNGYPIKLAYKQNPSNVKANTLSLSIAHKKKKLLPQKNQQQNIQFYKLHPYPQHFHLNQLSNKIGFHKIYNSGNAYKQIQQKQLEWSFIISQSLFYGSLVQEVNLLKLKNLAQNLMKVNNKFKIILRLHSERQINELKQKITQRKYPIHYIIWGKYRYFQTINIFDITEIALLSRSTKYIIVEDSHQIIRSVYFQYSYDDKQNSFNDYIDCKQVTLYKKITQSLFLHSKDNHSKINSNNLSLNMKKVDFNCKYLYLKLNGIPQLMKFTHKLKINHSEEIIQSQKILNCDETLNLFKLQQLRQKIKIGNIRKILKNKVIQQKNCFRDAIKENQKVRSKQKDREKSKDKQLRKSREISSKQIYNDRSQELKKKILQHVKVVQQQSQTNLRKNSVKLNNSQSRPKSTQHKMTNSHKNEQKIKTNIVKRPDTPSQQNEKGSSLAWPNFNTQSKSSNQIVSQLLKNNMLIQKQIWKFQEKTSALSLQELYSHKAQ